MHACMLKHALVRTRAHTQANRHRHTNMLGHSRHLQYSSTQSCRHPPCPAPQTPLLHWRRCILTDYPSTSPSLPACAALPAHLQRCAGTASWTSAPWRRIRGLRRSLPGVGAQAALLCARCRRKTYLDTCWLLLLPLTPSPPPPPSPLLLLLLPCSLDCLPTPPQHRPCYSNSCRALPAEQCAPLPCTPSPHVGAPAAAAIAHPCTFFCSCSCCRPARLLLSCLCFGFC